MVLETTLQGHQNPIYALVFDKENNLLYSAGNDKGIVEWDMSTKTFKRVLCAVPSSVYSMRIIPSSGYMVASLRSGGLMVIDKSATKLVAKLPVEKGAVFTIEVLDSKNELLAVDEYGKAYVWSLDKFELLYTFQVSTTAVRSVSVNYRKGLIALGDKDGMVSLFNLLDYQKILTKKVQDGSVTALSFFGEDLLSAGRDAKMYKLNVDDLSILQQIVPHMFTIYGIIPVSTNNFITISRDKTTKIWTSDFKLQKNVSRDKQIDSHHLSINTAAFNTITNILCTAGDDKLIKIWNLS